MTDGPKVADARACRSRSSSFAGGSRGAPAAAARLATLLLPLLPAFAGFPSETRAGGLYVLDASSELHVLVRSSPSAAVSAGAASEPLAGLAFDADGEALAVERPEGGAGALAFDLNPFTAALATIGRGGVTAPVALCFSPSDEAFVGSADAIHRLNRSTGATTRVALSGAGAALVALEFAGERLLAVTANDRLVEIALASGAATILGPLGRTGTVALAWDSEAGVLLGFSSSAFYPIDPTTGVAGAASPLPDSISGVADAAFVAAPIPRTPPAAGAAGAVFGADREGRLFLADPATGAVHVVGPTGLPLADLAISTSGELYGLEILTGSSSLYRVDRATAAVRRIGVEGGVGAQTNALGFAPDGELYAAGADFRVVNPANGAGAFIGFLGGGIVSGGDLAFSAAGAAFLSTSLGELASVSPVTGDAEVVGDTGFPDAFGLTFDAGGVLRGFSDATQQVFVIDPATGAGSSPVSFAGRGITGVLGVSEVAPPAPGRLANLSTRGYVGTGDSVMIAGLIVEGTLPRRVLISGIGPDLANFGVPDALANPTLSLFQGQTPVAGNDDWGSAPNAQAIQATGLAPNDALESAILVDLLPGEYTAILQGVGGTAGAGLVQAFDLGSGDARLSNISTRIFVGSGDRVMIAGLIVQGEGPRRLLVRALGPTLAEFGVQGTLADPTLTVLSGQTVLESNDDWGEAEDAEAILATGLQPPDGSEAAILLELAPGAYTAILSGVDGGSGNALVEIYEVP